ncbi:MAG: P1 family peptidase [Bilophila wadsworthia]
MDPLFRATVEATHEAIVNALCAATDTDGSSGGATRCRSRGARDHAALRIPLEAAAPHPPQRARRSPCSPEKEWANVLKRLKSQVFIVRQPSCRKKDAPRMGSVPHEQGVPYVEALFRHHGRGPLRAEPDRRQRLLG